MPALVALVDSKRIDKTVIHKLKPDIVDAFGRQIVKISEFHYIDSAFKLEECRTSFTYPIKGMMAEMERQMRVLDVTANDVMAASSFGPDYAATLLGGAIRNYVHRVSIAIDTHGKGDGLRNPVEESLLAAIPVIKHFKIKPEHVLSSTDPLDANRKFDRLDAGRVMHYLMNCGHSLHDDKSRNAAGVVAFMFELELG